MLDSFENLGANTPQPKPIHNNLPAVWDLVIEDIQTRDRDGQRKYNTRLQPFNGRNALVDLYQELLDSVVYLRQKIYELENPLPRYLLTGLAIHRDQSAWTVTASLSSIEGSAQLGVSRAHSQLMEAVRAVRSEMAALVTARSDSDYPKLSYSFETDALRQEFMPELFEATAEMDDYVIVGEAA